MLGFQQRILGTPIWKQNYGYYPVIFGYLLMSWIDFAYVYTVVFSTESKFKRRIFTEKFSGT